ncbi:MAG: hypothetical protein LC808_20795, partial [Actinobacteria bacterium]|nr:hypothetical protein [Actinomycetota bacterium]
MKTIDFDAVVWKNMLQPTIPKRFEAKRADLTGRLGLIDRVYIEWLAEADVVIADLTFSNANVYYELGIRHALSARGAVLLAQKGTNPPFDLRNQVILFYDVWNAGTFLGFQQALKNAILEAETDPGISPVHLYRPGLFVRFYEDGSTPDKEIDELRAQIAALQQESKSLKDDRSQRLLERIREASTRKRMLSLASQVRTAEFVPVQVLCELAAKLKGVECFDEAIESLERAAEMDNTDPEVYREIGFNYRLKGRQFFGPARANFERALDINDSDAELQGMIGGMLKRENKLLEAKARYERAHDLDKTDLYGVVALGAICVVLNLRNEGFGYYSEVLRLCRDAIERDDADHWTYFCMGEALFASGETDKAR